MFKVFIDGKAGTTGLRIYERLEKREDIQILTLSEELRKDVAARKEAMNQADVVFLCLPDDAAREAVALVENPNTIVIDASTAHRTNAAWAYGFPELDEKFLRGVQTNKRIANPGCYASGFLAIVYPLVKGGFVQADYPFVCHAVSGYTGAGKKGIAEYEDDNRSSLLEAPRSYALTQQHKHLKEMQKIAGLSLTPVFCPIISNFDCGMTVTVPVFSHLMSKKGTVKELFEYFKQYYANSTCLSVTQESEDGFLSANKLKNSNGLEIFVGGNDERIYLSARLDNLGKGASGAAIQNMNIALGLAENISL